jgi:hypothetical protein
MPVVGDRYVLFLKSDDSGHWFSILTGYDLRSEKVFALDSVDQYAGLDNTDRSGFLALVNEAIGSSIEGKQRGRRALSMRCHHFHSIHSRTILSGVTGRDRSELAN